ncbi:MAG: phosphate acetyltransferase [Puniceicoccaceae bacterium]|nr:MAG: phosphate acetyltransferase [Puniceicoccaceae bacterium]
MSLIATLIAKLQRHPKRFVFPEGSDPRILQAARQIASRRMGIPILLGDRTVIKEKAARLDLNLTGIRVIEPERSEDFAEFIVHFENLRRYKGLARAEAEQALRNNNYFATMMVATARADVIISGATATASSALRPIFQIIPRQEGVKTASSLMVLELEEKPIGIDGALFMADCGVIPEPTTEQLADIALTTATLARHLTNATPRVAMLSYSTRSTSTHASVVRMRAATELAREKADKLDFEIEIDGEMQVDAALDPATAATKGASGSVAGRANVLVFPDLNAGNIASKFVQITTGANMFGQIITGLSKPAAEISRGASAHDILGAAAIVGCQAIDHRLLYGTSSA